MEVLLITVGIVAVFSFTVWIYYRIMGKDSGNEMGHNDLE